MDGAARIAAERRRQVEEEHWLPGHDDEHDAGQLAMAAACYAAPESIFVHRKAESSFFSGNDGGRGDRQLAPAGYYDPWPWESDSDQRGQSSRLRQLEKAGALVAAEIDRLLRLEGQDNG